MSTPTGWLILGEGEIPLRHVLRPLSRCGNTRAEDQPSRGDPVEEAREQPEIDRCATWLEAALRRAGGVYD